MKLYPSNQVANPFQRSAQVDGADLALDPFALVTNWIRGSVTAGGAGVEGVTFARAVEPVG